MGTPQQRSLVKTSAWTKIECLRIPLPCLSKRQASPGGFNAFPVLRRPCCGLPMAFRRCHSHEKSDLCPLSGANPSVPRRKAQEIPSGRDYEQVGDKTDGAKLAWVIFARQGESHTAQQACFPWERRTARLPYGRSRP